MSPVLRVKHRIASIVLLVTTAFLVAPTSAAPGSPFAGPRTAPYSGVAWFMVGFELGPWEEYLIHELTPNLERLTFGDVPRVTWLELDDQLIIPDFAHSLFKSSQPTLALSVRQFRSALVFTDNNGFSGVNESRRFEQSFLMPGVTHQVSDNSAVTVSAILASQRFGSSGMNLREAEEPVALGGPYLPYEARPPEISHGAGLRFALISELVDGITVEAAYQSRIDMSEFASVRGVHGIHAELDIPPRVQLGLQVSATQRSWLSFGVSQIFYSEIGAFPSRSLPARFTALLGDSNSPQFAWNDLIVYDLGWHWRNNSDLELYANYRTRSQPSPSSPSLASALSTELAQNSVLLGVSKGVGNSRLHFNAAYAPPEFAFGGNVLGVVSDKLDQGIEVQALWSLEF